MIGRREETPTPHPEDSVQRRASLRTSAALLQDLLTAHFITKVSLVRPIWDLGEDEIGSLVNSKVAHVPSEGDILGLGGLPPPSKKVYKLTFVWPNMACLGPPL